MDFNVPYTDVSQKTDTLVPSSSGLHSGMAVGLVEVLLYIHKNRRLIRDGEPRTATSTFTQLLSSATGRTGQGVYSSF